MGQTVRMSQAEHELRCGQVADLKAVQPADADTVSFYVRCRLRLTEGGTALVIVSAAASGMNGQEQGIG